MNPLHAGLIRRFAKVCDAKYGGNILELILSDTGPVFRVRPRVVFGFTFGLPKSATRWTFDE